MHGFLQKRWTFKGFASSGFRFIAQLGARQVSGFLDGG